MQLRADGRRMGEGRGMEGWRMKEGNGREKGGSKESNTIQETKGKRRRLCCAWPWQLPLEIFLLSWSSKKGLKWTCGKHFFKDTLLPLWKYASRNAMGFGGKGMTTAGHIKEGVLSSSIILLKISILLFKRKNKQTTTISGRSSHGCEALHSWARDRKRHPHNDSSITHTFHPIGHIRSH